MEQFDAGQNSYIKSSGSHKLVITRVNKNVFYRLGLLKQLKSMFVILLFVKISCCTEWLLIIRGFKIFVNFVFSHP